jgi:hypothetical protein
MRRSIGHAIHSGETGSSSGEQRNVVLASGSADVCTVGAWASTSR